MLALVVLTALGTLSTLTVFSVKGGIQTSANDRFHEMALYAAESGGAAAMDFLRQNQDPLTGWKAFISPSNSSVQVPSGITGNNAPPGDPNNPFSTDINSYYKVEIYNNRSDTGYVLGNDDDKRVVLRSTGYGPNGAVAIIEWEIKSNASSSSRPCPSYGQKNESEDNSGRNDCLGNINTSDTATYTP